MMFDILEDKEIDDWKPYLAGALANHSDKKMPMMRVGAVPIARKKNNKMGRPGRKSGDIEETIENNGGDFK